MQVTALASVFTQSLKQTKRSTVSGERSNRCLLNVDDSPEQESSWCV